ncbi:MAG: DedA family protein [Chloroflexi bacterium]|nr:DedA family protein [Chloroflexota bacterium]MBI3931422.1 DedA family protein [Chloroflexota bacterium]
MLLAVIGRITKQLQFDATAPICYTAEVPPLEQELLHFIGYVYTRIQWPGVIVLMAIESACIPLPSELIMPLAGWMLIKEQSLPAIYTLLAGAYGALGNTIGSVIAYMAGMWGGRPFLEKYGRYLLISRRDLALADQWFDKSGHWSIFISRLLPVVRTFISLPAGIARMHLVRFLVYTFFGSFIWSAGLAYGGYLLGSHWEQIRTLMRPFDPLIGALIITFIAFYIYRHLKHFRLRS